MALAPPNASPCNSESVTSRASSSGDRSSPPSPRSNTGASSSSTITSQPSSRFISTRRRAAPSFAQICGQKARSRPRAVMSVFVTRTFAAARASDTSSAADDGSAAAKATISVSVSATVSTPVTSGSSGNGEIFRSSSCAFSSKSSRSSTGRRRTFTNRRESGTDRITSRVLNAVAASWKACASRSAAAVSCAPSSVPSPFGEAAFSPLPLSAASSSDGIPCPVVSSAATDHVSAASRENVPPDSASRTPRRNFPSRDNTVTSFAIRSIISFYGPTCKTHVTAKEYMCPTLNDDKLFRPCATTRKVLYFLRMNHRKQQDPTWQA